MKYLKTFESYNDGSKPMARVIAEDILDDIIKLRKEKGSFTVSDLEDYMSKGKGISEKLLELIDEVVIEVVNLVDEKGLEFEFDPEDDDIEFDFYPEDDEDYDGPPPGFEGYPGPGYYSLN